MDVLHDRYGDDALMSAPVDPDHPSFSSLLSALEAVHHGRVGSGVLRRYHDVLSAEVSESRASIEGEFAEDEEERQVALSALEVTEALLDAIDEYLQAPGDETMAFCVAMYLEARQFAVDAEAYFSGDDDEDQDSESPSQDMPQGV